MRAVAGIGAPTLHKRRVRAPTPSRHTGACADGGPSRYVSQLSPSRAPRQMGRIRPRRSASASIPSRRGAGPTMSRPRATEASGTRRSARASSAGSTRRPGKTRHIALGDGLGAARGHRRPRWSAVDHRRRAERDRPGRPEDTARPPLPAARVVARRQPEYRDLRPPRHPLVHRAERHLRAARPAQREDAGLHSAARSRSVRDHGDAVGRRLLRLACRQLPRPRGRRAFDRARAAAADRAIRARGARGRIRRAGSG